MANLPEALEVFYMLYKHLKINSQLWVGFLATSFRRWQTMGAACLSSLHTLTYM